MPSSELVKIYTHATIWRAEAVCSRLRIWLLKYWAEYHAFRLAQNIREMNLRRTEWLKLEHQELENTWAKGGTGLNAKEREMQLRLIHIRRKVGWLTISPEDWMALDETHEALFWDRVGHLYTGVGNLQIRHENDQDTFQQTGQELLLVYLVVFTASSQSAWRGPGNEGDLLLEAVTMTIEQDLHWVDQHWRPSTWAGQAEPASTLLEKAMLQILRDHYRMIPVREQRETWWTQCKEKDEAEDLVRRRGTDADEEILVRQRLINRGYALHHLRKVWMKVAERKA